MTFKFVDELADDVRHLGNPVRYALAICICALVIWFFVKIPVMADYDSRRLQVLIGRSDIFYDVNIIVDAENNLCSVRVTNIHTRSWDGDIRLIIRAVYPELKESKYIADIVLSPTAPRHWGSSQIEFISDGRKLDLQMCIIPQESQ